jgi:hypothetical protein
MGNDPKDSVLNKWNQMHELVTCLLQMVLACHLLVKTFFNMALTARAADYAVKELKKGNI